MTLLPKNLSYLLLFGLMSLYLVSLLYMAVMAFSDSMGSMSRSILDGITSVPAAVTMGVLLRRWSHEQYAIRSHMKAFSISMSSCFDENDRPAVESNVVAFMKLLNLVHVRAW